MQKVNPRGKSQERYFFLFCDMLLWCKPKAGKKGYLFKGSRTESDFLVSEEEATQQFEMAVTNGVVCPVFVYC